MDKHNAERASCLYLLEETWLIPNPKWKVGEEWKWREYLKHKGSINVCGRECNGSELRSWGVRSWPCSSIKFLKALCFHRKAEYVHLHKRAKKSPPFWMSLCNTVELGSNLIVEYNLAIFLIFYRKHSVRSLCSLCLQMHWASTYVSDIVKGEKGWK